MDHKTSKFYSTRTKDLFDLYKTVKTEGLEKYFAPAFPAGARLLDIGAGSGRDLMKLLEAGYDARGIDASEEMVRRAISENSQLAERLIRGSVPSEGKFFGGMFDGIICSAVMMHIPDEQLCGAAESIRANLMDRGRLLLSVPLSRDDLDENSRCPDGRLFLIRSAGYYDFLFEKHGFRKISFCEEEDSLGREGIRWGVMIYEGDF
jgi:SAM-dependent methyltransferase